MQDRVKIVIILTFLMTLSISSNVFGYAGKGTKSNPYVVSSESDLRGALTEHTDKTSWIYIAVNDTVAITKTIEVTDGKYRIYAIDANQTIRRSSKLNVKVNDKDDSKYCIHVKGSSHVVFGYNASKYKLVINGNRNVFEGKRECTGWIYVHNGATVTFDVNSHFKNAINNKVGSSMAPIASKGIVNLNGEISDCSGINGGAINVLQGVVNINQNAKIHDCEAKTEGGAIHLTQVADLVMSGGQIYNCKAGEEGGAIFSQGSSLCEITGGTIKNNTAGASAGGVFSGYGATLIIGVSYGNGPEIAYNKSAGSGGGVRCNGGNSELAGGTTYIYGGNIHHNSSGKYGGGIACGTAGSESKSKLFIQNTEINNNSAIDGGGIWIPKKAMGTGTNSVIIDLCKIKYNTASGKGGGLMVYSKVDLSYNQITDNYAKGKGGGAFIDSVGTLTLSSGTISQNKSTGQGSGIYVKGRFQILSNASVNTDNIVYLSLNTYIDVIGKLVKNSGYIAQIDSEAKANGTILVKAGYTGTTASKELYYSGTAEDEYEGKTVVKKYTYYGLGKNRCLRPSEKVNGYNNCYIILSEKYTVSYDKNTTDNVKDIPKDQTKFWEENIVISNNILIRDGHGIDDEKHWNLNKDGSGLCIKPGKPYTLNESRTLYAQWISWMIMAKDRYYVVGQNVVLNKEELLRKVVVTDNKNNNASYTFKVKQIKKEDGTEIAKGTDIVTDHYMNTSVLNQYVLTFGVSSNKSSSSIIASINVYVMDIPLIKGRTRFISIKYINTLQSDSRWCISLKDKLISSLKKNEGQGIYKINISSERVKQIKNNVKSNNYKITSAMNKQLMENWR